MFCCCCCHICKGDLIFNVSRVSQWNTWILDFSFVCVTNIFFAKASFNQWWTYVKFHNCILILWNINWMFHKLPPNWRFRIQFQLLAFYKSLLNLKVTSLTPTIWKTSHQTTQTCQFLSQCGDLDLYIPTLFYIKYIICWTQSKIQTTAESYRYCCTRTETSNFLEPVEHLMFVKIIAWVVSHIRLTI